VLDSKRLANLFDRWVVRMLQAILGFGVLAAVAVLVLLVVRGALELVGRIESVGELQQAVQSLFAGVLLVVLGLELMDTLRNYFIEHRVRVELLLSVALIAEARHVIQLDYTHVSPSLVAAMALLLFALAASYVGVRAMVREAAPRRG
jgi:uncharacterized membrane protein (DUF373 family)